MNRDPRHRKNDPSDEAERLDLAGLLPPPPVPALGPDREPLLRETLLREAALADRPAGRAARTPRPRRRPVLWIVAPAVACALALGVVVTVDLPDASGRDERAVPGDTAPGSPEAARLLGRVALAAAAGNRPAVRTDQFVYVESKVAHASRSAGGGPVTLPPARSRQVWLSADGSRPGLLRVPGEPDTPLRAGGPVHTLESRGATPRPGTLGEAGPSIGDPTHQYVASLPTDPDALLRLIRDQTRGQGQNPDQRAFTAIGELLTETWAPPQVSAALYRAAAKIPGVTVTGSAVDAAGREGVAVARTAHGEQTQWVFDRTSHAFLGERTVLTRDGDAGPAGTVVGTSAILTRAAVDRAGLLPAD
ncbi:hypothetical protein GCM10010232_15350 [Streptomyces amakusaensis]|uniref:CU044_5270 family protein n=1 Tax=Streptomyces amakusaensis TaxID=67271 RepID=A0ABW0AGZ9_9ACTN